MLLNIKYYCKWDPIHLNILRTLCNQLLFLILVQYNTGLMMAVIGETCSQ